MKISTGYVGRYVNMMSAKHRKLIGSVYLIQNDSLCKSLNIDFNNLLYNNETGALPNTPRINYYIKFNIL